MIKLIIITSFITTSLDFNTMKACEYVKKTLKEENQIIAHCIDDKKTSLEAD